MANAVARWRYQSARAPFSKASANRDHLSASARLDAFVCWSVAFSASVAHRAASARYQAGLSIALIRQVERRPVDSSTQGQSRIKRRG